MVVIDIDESLSVTVTAGEAKPCAYAVVYRDEEITQYETSADPRTIGGRIGLRNVVCQRIPDYDRAVIEEKLSVEISEHTDALTEELGAR